MIQPSFLEGGTGLPIWAMQAALNGALRVVKAAL